MWTTAAIDSTRKPSRKTRSGTCSGLENKGQQPWTTAPAFAMNGAMPVAQDTLNYTPAGGRSTLKLTVAADVRGEQTPGRNRPQANQYSQGTSTMM